MKYSMIAVSSLGLLFGIGAACAEEPAEANVEVAESTETVELSAEAPPSPESIELKTNEQKVNYSLGYELGKDLTRQELTLAPEAVLKGAQDGISGARPMVDATQRQAALKEIREKRAQENREQSQAFLAANAEKDGVQTLPSGLQYKEIQAGEGRAPGPDDTVVLHYRGTLIDGTEWTSTHEGDKPNAHKVKALIKGFREGVQLMKEGAKWELFIPPELGYGKKGRSKAIPPNSVLIMEVELIAIK